MQTVELKLIVEKLASCSDEFVNQYTIFKEDTLMELPEEYDRFIRGICDCYEALGVVIGTAEVENIKNRR
jgi:hypothetical protein